MPTAKPRYDSDGSWKRRQFSASEWDDLEARIRKKLRPYYPDKNATADSTFGHPADGFANAMLSEAESAISMILGLRLRLTNEELRAERTDVLIALTKAEYCLSNLSHDFDIMLGVDADVRGCRDKLRELIPRVEGADAAIRRLSRAKRLTEAQAEAAVAMAIGVLRIWKGHGGSTGATADVSFDRTSDAVKILKILGDGLGLCLAEKTWVTSIGKAKQKAPDL